MIMRALWKILSLLNTLNATRKGRLHKNLANKAAHKQTAKITRRGWK